jgi:hypothetical protein
LRGEAGSDKLLGDHTLVLSDWEPGVWHDQWVTVCSPLAGKSLPTRMGRSMAQEGLLVPKYPIVLLPGTCAHAPPHTHSRQDMTYVVRW